jgi:hypothetical protein
VRAPAPEYGERSQGLGRRRGAYAVRGAGSSRTGPESGGRQARGKWCACAAFEHCRPSRNVSGHRPNPPAVRPTALKACRLRRMIGAHRRRAHSWRRHHRAGAGEGEDPYRADPMGLILSTSTGKADYVDRILKGEKPADLPGRRGRGQGTAGRARAGRRLVPMCGRPLRCKGSRYPTIPREPRRSGRPLCAEYPHDRTRRDRFHRLARQRLGQQTPDHCRCDRAREPQNDEIGTPTPRNLQHAANERCKDWCQCHDRAHERQFSTGACTFVEIANDGARVYGKPMQSLGLHRLRGLSMPHELFAPRIAAASTAA